MIRNGKILIGILLSIATAITFIPFFKVGFTTADDLEYYLTWLRGDLLGDAHNYAQNTGRFYFLITKPIYSLVYWLDNFYLTKFLQHSTLLFSYIAFSYLIYKILKSKSIAIATYLVLIISTPITGNWHMPFIAYPGYFTTSFGLMCCAIILHIKYLETTNYRYILYSALLYLFVVLFYETYLLFLCYFCIFIIAKWIYENGAKKTFFSKGFYKEIMPFAAVGILYVVTYFTYSHFSTSSYSGATIASNFSLKNFFIILKRCTNEALPLHSYLYDAICVFVQSGTLPASPTHSFLFEEFTWEDVPIRVYINALLVGGVTLFLVRGFRGNLSWKRLVLLLCLSLFFAYTSHFLIGLTEKYNTEWYSWMQGYVTTYYSFFGIVFSTIVIAYSLLKLVKSNNILFSIVGLAEIICVLIITITTGYSNNRYSKKWEQTQAVFPMMDKMITQGMFDSVTQHDVVYAEDMYQFGPFGNCLWHPHIYWSDYIYQKSGKVIRDCKNIDELRNQMNKAENIYYLSHIESVNDYAITFSKINKDEFNTHGQSFNDIKSDSAIVFWKTSKDTFLTYNNHSDSVLLKKDSPQQKIIIVDKNVSLNSFSFSSY